MGSFRERQRQVREDEILNRAERLLGAKGYHAMAMDELSEAVGIAKATLYQHFATKEDLVAAVIIRSMLRFVDQVANRSLDLGPLDRLTQALGWVIDQRYAEPAAEDIGPMMEEFFRIFSVRSDFAAAQQRCWLCITDLVDEAKAQGQVQASLSTPVLVGVFYSLAMGYYCGVLVKEGTVSVETLKNTLTSIFVGGVAATSGTSVAGPTSVS